MKALLLGLSMMVCASPLALAQTRMTLHEEFTGENCPPCASTNPGFWALCDGASNPSKLIHISYMEPIPSSGWYYMRTKTLSDNRASYYSVPFAPYGRFDGAVPDPTAADPGHPGYFTQADIDAEAAIASPFNLTVSSAWNATYDSIVSTVTITCVSAYTGTSVYLRTALIQTNDFASSPGTNGETHFANVVQAMYPNATGTSIASTWTAGTTQTLTITGAVPAFVDASASPYIVVWIQNDGDKSIAQAAKAAPLPRLTNDAGLSAMPGTTCIAGGSGTVSPSVTITNTGGTTLTSATIYYSIDGGAMSSQPWTGSLATGASTSVTLSGLTATAGSHTLYDSVAGPNAAIDHNTVNNAATTTLLVQSNTTTPSPLTNNFETGLPANWTYFDMNGNGQNWAAATVTGHAGGTKAAKHDNYDYSNGEANMIILPDIDFTTGVSFTFWVAYAQYSTENDKLELVVSHDCGTTWDVNWSKAGSALSTTAATTSPFTPSAAAQWRQETAFISPSSAGTIMAFRGTSNYGNNLYIDDINATAVPTGVANVNVADMELHVYPNPAQEQANLTFSLSAGSTVVINVTDQLGRTVIAVANEKADAGSHSYEVNTSSLSAGVYLITVRTDNGTMTQQLSVTK